MNYQHARAKALKRIIRLGYCIGVISTIFSSGVSYVDAAYRFDDYKASPPLHILGVAETAPKGLSPSQVKTIYHLPQSVAVSAGTRKTIAIIGAYEDADIESDLAAFDKAFALPSCTIGNGCLEKHSMADASSKSAAAVPATKAEKGWDMEAALDVEWAHAIDPSAKILLVEAETPSGANLLKAVDYARGRSDVVSVSMSWGGPEFKGETSLDSHFTSTHSVAFFASSGDSGAGSSWPAASPKVISVGGTHVHLSSAGAFVSETAWDGSGGGISTYEKEPAYQKTYNISRSHGMRAIPDVAYDADPSSGYSVYHAGGWYVVGGTSAGSPQWAAIAALDISSTSVALTAAKLYKDKSSASNSAYFRDIISGTNGDCGYLCSARSRYDYVTGLGSPQSASF